MQDHTKLIVWQRARALTVAIDQVARGYRSQSVPGLRGQTMRAAMSIAANLAEGAARGSRSDFARFVSMSAASASELEHHLMVAEDLGMLEATIGARLRARTVELRKMLFALRKALVQYDIARETTADQTSIRAHPSPPLCEPPQNSPTKTPDN